MDASAKPGNEKDPYIEENFFIKLKFRDIQDSMMTRKRIDP